MIRRSHKPLTDMVLEEQAAELGERCGGRIVEHLEDLRAFVWGEQHLLREDIEAPLEMERGGVEAGVPEELRELQQVAVVYLDSADAHRNDLPWGEQNCAPSHHVSATGRAA